MTEVTITQGNGHVFVLEMCHRSKTNRLGRTQRRILDYLATAPGGFRYVEAPAPDHRRITDHGQPYGVTVAEIARTVYATDGPTAAQIRTVQRAVRRLAELGLVDCWHGAVGWTVRRFVTCHDEIADGPRPVSGLWVALRWDCEHLNAQREQEAREYAEYETWRRTLLSGDPVTALQSMLGGAR